VDEKPYASDNQDRGQYIPSRLFKDEPLADQRPGRGAG